MFLGVDRIRISLRHHLAAFFGLVERTDTNRNVAGLLAGVEKVPAIGQKPRVHRAVSSTILRAGGCNWSSRPTSHWYAQETVIGAYVCAKNDDAPGVPTAAAKGARHIRHGHGRAAENVHLLQLAILPERNPAAVGRPKWKTGPRRVAQGLCAGRIQVAQPELCLAVLRF